MTSGLGTYQSLPAQVASRIAKEIAEKKWVDWLPGERAIAETLQVSRKTVRKAIGILQHDGVIRTAQGLGHEIITRAPGKKRGRPDIAVGLLAPDSLEQLRPFTALWVDALRSLLIEKGCRLTTFSGHRYFTQRPEKSLARLVNQNPQDCWILAHSNERVQKWFQDEQVSCVIAGSSHQDLDLPSVDLDYFAVCRHAVGAMLRHGHRRIGLLTKISQRAGDLESEAGFSAGTRQPSYSNIVPHIIRHDGTVPGVNRMLARMFDLPSPPTALLIVNPVYYLTAVTFLAGRGLRVPRDVSLISREDDTFLSYINPAPARYTCQPRTFAKRLMQPLLLQLRGEKLPHTSFRIESKYVPGPSLATISTQVDKTSEA